MNTSIAIAKNTFLETIRDKILLSVVVLVIGIIAFSLFIASISLDQSTRIILDFGVTAIYILQIFIAIFIGSMLMFKEIERKTFYLLLPKPVSRTAIIIGKCAGLTTTTIVVTTLATIALLAVIALQGAHVQLATLLTSLILSTIESVLLILISILFSSFTSPIIAAVATLTFYLVGHSGEIFRHMMIMSKQTFVQIISAITYYVFPNLEKFNIRNDVVYSLGNNQQSFLIAIIYGFAYAILILVVAQIIFKRRDF